MASHSPSNQAEKELTTNDLAELLNVLTPVASKSHALGLQLRIPYSQILNIEVNHRTIEDQLCGILAARLKQEASLKWKDIVRALKTDSIGEYYLARKIESQYMPPSHVASLALQQGTVVHSSIDIPSWSPKLHVNPSGVHATSLALPQPSANSVMSVPHPLPHAGYHVVSEQERMYCPPQPKRLRQQLAETQPPSHTQQPAPLRNTATCSTTHISSPQLLTHTPAAHPISPVSSTQPSATNVVSEIPYADHQVVSQQQPMYDNPPSHHLYTSMPFNEQSYIIPPPQFPNYYLHPPTFPSFHFVLYYPSAPYTTSSPQTQEQSVVRPENIQHDPSQYLPPYIGPVSTPHSDSWDSPAAEWHTQRLACQSPSYTQQPAVTVPLNNTHQATETASSNNTQQTTVRASPSQKTVADTHLPRLFIDYVTTIYKGSPVETNPTAVKWPPTPSKVYINLVCIDRKARGLRREYDEITEAMVRDGNVDVILYGGKWPIDMNEIVSGISGTDCKKLVLIEGAPGVGKSTFAWEFCRRWVRGELAQQYELVLLLRLRDERISKATMLKDLIYHPSEEVRQNVVTHLESTLGARVLIILEGYDELSDEYRNVLSVFMQLIYGQLLPLATVMVTSRPWATCELHADCRNWLFKHIEILGFNKEQISLYLKSVDDVTGLNDYIKRHPQIGMCMYIPLNCAIVVTVYQESQDSGHALPTTLTELYKALTRILLIRYLRGHHQDKEGTKYIKIFKDLPVPRHVHNHFVELCKLAYSGIVESCDNRVQLIFRDLPSDFDNLGFMNSVTDLYVTQGTVSSHNFLHLTFQEFFAAVHISFMSPSEQLRHFSMYKEHTGRLNAGRLNVVLRFLAGLNKLDCFSRENLTHIFESKGNPVPCNLTIDNAHVQWMFEAQNDDVTKFVLGKNMKIRFKSVRMLAMDYYSLGYCLASSQSEWVLSIGGEIDVEEVKLLVAAKTSIGCRIIGLGGAWYQQKSSMGNLQISHEALDLFFSGLDFRLHLLYLRLPSTCDCITWPDLSALQDLRLEVNHKTNWRLDSLLPHLSLRSFTVVGGIADHELDSPGLSCEDCAAIGNVIKSTNLNKLHIGESGICMQCHIKDDGMETLTRALASNSSLPLEDLGLICCCGFTNTAAEYLAQFVTRSSTLKYLSIGGSLFNAHGLLVLAQAVDHSPSLQEKVINKKDMTLTLKIDGDDEAKDLATLLVEYSNLGDCGRQSITGISEVGAIALSQALNSSKMAVLWFLNSSIKDEGARALGNTLHCNLILKELHLPNNSIHNAGAIAIALHHNSTLQMLDLSFNSISDEGATALARALHHNSTLQMLDLSFNSISDEGATALARALHHNSTLQTLDLSCNSISDEGAVALAQALHVNSTLRQLNLAGNEGIGKEGCNCLVQALTINISIINGEVAEGIPCSYTLTPYNGLMLPESCEEHILECSQYDEIENKIYRYIANKSPPETGYSHSIIMARQMAHFSKPWPFRQTSGK